MKTTAIVLVACGFIAAKTSFAGDPPSVALGRFGQAHLDRILAPIDQNVNLPRNELTQLRGSFTVWMAKAPPNEQPAWRAAFDVCDALSNAMNEREKARASFQNSSRVPGATDLHARRKDRPRYWEYRRERDEREQRKQEEKEKDVFLNRTLQTHWVQRALQLRQTIERRYVGLQQLELQAQQTVGQPPAARRDTVTLEKPTAVHVKYGDVTLPAGTSLHVISRDPRGITVEYNGELVIVPPQ